MLSSAANALRALEHLVERGDSGVSEIARHLDVTVGTGHRILVTLVEMGFAEQNPETRRYRPSGKVLSLAQQMRGRVNARDRVHLHLVELVQEVRESAHLAVLDEGWVHYIDKVASDQPFGIEFRVGSRLPAHSTALGKVLLAFDDGVDLDTVIKASESSEGVGRPVDRERLISSLRAVRTAGLAEDAANTWPTSGASPRRSAAAAVTSSPRSTSPLRSRFDAARAQMRREVRRSAERISEDLRQLGVDDLSA